ncbi:YheC/YheD family protein [Paenibacillus sp. S3N08]|uniref:YheC/YheD family protein n=2 Tax=Paenibacillus agricola TaxID=2716264 RepID=A0ABX0J866_9BACL|nr:YheC/YheD family protein [Paenibacillus agricola]
MLEQDGRFSAYLPRTVAMRSVGSIAGWLQAHSEVLLKPQAGSQGRGVLLVQRREPAGEAAGAQTQGWRASGRQRKERTAVADGAKPSKRQAEPAGAAMQGSRWLAGQKPGASPLRAATPAVFSVRGRDARNRRIARDFADEAALLLWLRRFTARRRYLQQQYLLLQTHTGDAYDVRALVQKDGSGRWALTGMAVRQGQDGSLTSNLHGGGTTQPACDFLEQQFGAAQAASIISELGRLSELIPEALEARHGRLVELGIDYGIDTAGKPWILEVNSKPGRSIFAHIEDNKMRIRAITNPIRYARYLLQQAKLPLYRIPTGSSL